MSNASWTKLDQGWVQIKVPLPFSLKWVNSYLLPERDGYTVIDPGLRTPDAERVWEEALASLAIEWQDLKQIVLTHYHPDHYGLAGWMQERSGAPVYLSETGMTYAQRLWGEGETFSDQLLTAFLAHGLPDALLDGMRLHLESVKAQVRPHPQQLRVLVAGERMRLGGLDWELIGGEGHAPGHLSFYNQAHQLILCGDQVLPDITPNIGWMPGGDSDPLGAYLASLERMQAYEVGRAFPGHRDPFPEFSRRLTELRGHHERRLLRMITLGEEMAAVQGGSYTAYEMCEQLFGQRVKGNPHNLRFAMAETIAHLIRLERMGHLAVEEAAAANAASLSLIRYKPLIA